MILREKRRIIWTGDEIRETEDYLAEGFTYTRSMLTWKGRCVLYIVVHHTAVRYSSTINFVLRCTVARGGLAVSVRELERRDLRKYRITPNSSATRRRRDTVKSADERGGDGELHALWRDLL